MSRFDYVRYDEQGGKVQEKAKELVTQLEQFILANMAVGRASALAVTKLEECYMWVGKQIRDDQIKRNGFAPLQEQRKNG